VACRRASFSLGLHQAQKTTDIVRQTDSTLDTAIALLALTDSLSPEAKDEILADLKAHKAEFRDLAWSSTGRLARLGLPRSIVTPVRN
jgi:hypothetical protein